MELSRRKVLHAGLACGLALATGWTWLRTTPARWVQAVRRGRYPGRLKPLNEKELQQPGRWLG